MNYEVNMAEWKKRKEEEIENEKKVYCILCGKHISNGNTYFCGRECQKVAQEKFGNNYFSVLKKISMARRKSTTEERERIYA